MIYKTQTDPYLKNSYQYWSEHIEPSASPLDFKLKDYLQWIKTTYRAEFMDASFGQPQFIFESESDRTIFMLKWG